MFKIGNVKIYTIEEIAKKFGVSIATIRRYLKAQKLSGQKVGTRWHVSEHAIDEFFLKGYIKPAKAGAKK